MKQGQSLQIFIYGGENDNALQYSGLENSMDLAGYSSWAGRLHPWGRKESVPTEHRHINGGEMDQ